MTFRACGFGVLSFCLLMALAGCGDSGDEAATAGDGDQENSSSAGSSNSEPDRPSSVYPQVVIYTNMGEIVVELDSTAAPITVQNFLDYVDANHYDDTLIHQVVSDMIILGGGYTPELVRKSENLPIYNEAHNGLKNERGTIAMARVPAAVDSATCQFFINVKDNPDFDHVTRDGSPDEYGYCVFGRVVEGMNLVDQLSKLSVTERTAGSDVFQNFPERTVRIDSIRRY